jgi:hypothetical protein
VKASSLGAWRAEPISNRQGVLHLASELKPHLFCAACGEEAEGYSVKESLRRGHAKECSSRCAPADVGPRCLSLSPSPASRSFPMAFLTVRAAAMLHLADCEF